MPTFRPYASLEQMKAAKKKTEIVIPAWNDIIHIALEPYYTAAELNRMETFGKQVIDWGRSVDFVSKQSGLPASEVESLADEYRMYKDASARRRAAAMDILKSPTPQIARNVGVIMTALDDIQDFTTTVGVLSRALGRVYKPFDAVAVGAFTIGSWLNRLNLVNRLTGGETAVICRLVRSLKSSSMRTRTKADVNKRMKRMFPSKGELIEIAQTTDNLFGVGISLGPLVGLVQDAIFGAFTGAPIRFREWKMTEREQKVLQNAYKIITDPGPAFTREFLDSAKWSESASHIIAAGAHIEWQDFAKGLITSIEAGLKVRAKGVKDAVISSWEIITGKKAVPKKHTSISTRFLLGSLGVDSYRQDAWPVYGLGDEATIQEIMDAYSSQAQKVLQYWREKLGSSDEGLFLDACVKEIGLQTALMFCDDGGVVTESLDPYALMFVHALEAHLNPPLDTSDEKFSEWAEWILGQMNYYSLGAPDLKLLQEAYHRFF